MAFIVLFVIVGMGENNCSWSRKLHLHRDTMVAAASIYKGEGFCGKIVLMKITNLWTLSATGSLLCVTVVFLCKNGFLW